MQRLVDGLFVDECGRSISITSTVEVSDSRASYAIGIDSVMW